MQEPQAGSTDRKQQPISGGNEYVYDEEPGQGYDRNRYDARRYRRVITANTVCMMRGLSTVRRPLPNTTLLLGGI